MNCPSPYPRKSAIKNNLYNEKKFHRNSKLRSTEEKYFMIDQQIARITMKVFTNTLPFYTTQIITFFLLQGSQPITIKGLDFSQSENPYTR